MQVETIPDRVYAGILTLSESGFTFHIHVTTPFSTIGIIPM